MHFTPTGCSWLNMVERFFRDLTENRLRRGVFRSVEELIEATLASTSTITTNIPKTLHLDHKGRRHPGKASSVPEPRFIIGNLHDALH